MKPTPELIARLEERFRHAVIEIVPRRAFLWEDGRTDRAPEVFELTGAAV